MASTDDKELSNVNEEGASDSTSIPLANVVKDLEKTDAASEAIAAVSLDLEASGDHLLLSPSAEKSDNETNSNALTNEAITENLLKAESGTGDENPGANKSDSYAATLELGSNREPSNAKSHTTTGSEDSDSMSQSLSELMPEMKTIPVKTLTEEKDLPAVSSPAYPDDEDGYSSEKLDDFVLKWDDDEESDGPQEKNPQDAITMDKKKDVTKDFVLHDKDMLDKIDAQISELSSKNLVPEVSGSCERDNSGVNLKAFEDTHTSPQLIESNDSQEKSCDFGTKDSVKKAVEEADNSMDIMDVDTINVSVDSIIADLDQMIDEDYADVDKTATTAKLDENITPEVTDVQPSEDQPLDTKTAVVQNANKTENKVTCMLNLGKHENQMDLDHSQVQTAEGVEATAEVYLTKDPVDMDVDANVVEDSFIASDLDKSTSKIKIIANSTEIELDTSEVTKNDSIASNVDNKLLEDIKNVPSYSTELDMSTSDQDITIEIKEHNLKKPDMMIEIPTQELITLPDDTLDISDKDLSTSNLCKELKEPDEIVLKAIKSSETIENISENIQGPTDNQTLEEIVENLTEHDKEKLVKNVTVQQKDSYDKSDDIYDTKEAELITDIENTVVVVDKSNIKELKSDLKEVEGNSTIEIKSSVDEMPCGIADHSNYKTKGQAQIENITSLKKEQAMKTEDRVLIDIDLPPKDTPPEIKDTPMNADITSVDKDLVSEDFKKVRHPIVTEDKMETQDLSSNDKVQSFEIKDTPSISDDINVIKQGLISNDSEKVEQAKETKEVMESKDIPSNKILHDSEFMCTPSTSDGLNSIKQGLISEDLKKHQVIDTEDQNLNEDMASKDKDKRTEIKDTPINDEMSSIKHDQTGIDQASEIKATPVKDDELSVNQDLASKNNDQPSENESNIVTSVNQDLISQDQTMIHKDTSVNDDTTFQNQEFIVKNHKEVEKESACTDIEEPIPDDNQSPAIDQSIKKDILSNLEQPLDENEPQMAADTSDEVPDVTDSLGLLAESSRVMDDDEEQETSDHDDGDDEEDDDDESSNQMTAEHSEDSNAQNSETDMPKDKSVDINTNEQTDIENVAEFIPELETPDAEKPEFNFAITNVFSAVDKDGDMEVDDYVAGDDVAGDDVDASTDLMGDDNEEVEPDLEDTTSPTTPAVLDPEEAELDKETAEEAATPEQQLDQDTVRLSDTSDTEENTAVVMSEKTCQLRKLLIDKDADEYFKNKMANKIKQETDETKESPTKIKKLEITKPKNVVNYVDLEETSSEDDVQEIGKQTDTAEAADDVTNVNIPSQIEIMSSGENTSTIVTKEGEVVISGVPKPPPLKPARLNTGEVTIKTAGTTESTLVIPETKATGETSKPKLSLEVFSLDSDDDDSTPVRDNITAPASPPEKKFTPTNNQCINNQCTSDNSVPYYTADPSTMAYYNANKKQKAMVCLPCAEAVAKRAKTLVEGIKNLTPLMELEMSRLCEELVEISDSDSEGSEADSGEVKETIGAEGAKLLEEQLTEVMNATWQKYDMDARLAEAQGELTAELARLEEMGNEINAVFDECQAATDALRQRLYITFEPKRQELPPIVVFDTPDNMFACTESAELVAELGTPPAPPSKRRLSSASETPAKRAAIPLGYAPLDNEPVHPQAAQACEPAQSQTDTSSAEPPQETKPALPSTSAFVPSPLDTSKIDDDKDISVVHLSAEKAPADLPPPGEIVRAPLRAPMQVYAMRNAFGSWLRARICDVQPKGATTQSAQFTMCRVKFESKTHKNAFKQLPGRCLAYHEPAEVRMTIGTRVIALFRDSTNVSKRESFYSGVVAEVPNPVNNYRYLVFFDDGYAQYVRHADTRLVCEYSMLVWEEVHPFSRDFVREYLMAYPERPMVRLHTGQTIKTEWNGKWWLSRVLQVDASLVHVHFQEDNRTEWIYRGSTRLAPLYLELQAAERHRARPLPRNRAQTTKNMPYVEYTRSDEMPAAGKSQTQTQSQAQAQEEIRRQRSVAKKSTGAPLLPPQAPLQNVRPPPAVAPVPETVTSRVVYYTPKNAVRPYRLTPHVCGPKCRRSDVLALQDLRTYNPLAKPLLSGWERQMVRFKGHKEVMYRAPCGRRLRNVQELHRYLRCVQSDMGVDLFDFEPTTHCLAEFVLNKCIIAKKDLSNGKENVPVPCVNYYDHSLPEFCSYNTERTPTEGVPLNLDPEFLCGCDCTDDCMDKTKCACWQLTMEGARTIGLSPNRVGYEYKRLPEPLPSGIYECNSRCKCKSTCLNRVAQHPLQLKLQVFKTLNRGWGIRALNDVPKGSFLCVYAGNLLTDATANMDGLNEGDEYLAELDYIEVVEQMKEGFEEDIPDSDKKLDKGKEEDSEEEMTSSEEEEQTSRGEKEDGDFEPGYIGLGVTQFSKRLRKRARAKRGAEKAALEGGEAGGCITISDDEEVREPSRFMAQAGMGANEFISKYRSVRSLFGKDEACYIMDAKVQGNIGRYLNHSCSPNVFVQNVFVDTHDPRFPWVAFFALWPIRAGTELTWNYNYDVGSVPGKALYCYCGAPNCRGRLL